MNHHHHCCSLLLVLHLQKQNSTECFTITRTSFR
jgi:hypothetical protein